MSSIFTNHGYWDGKINPEPEASRAAYSMWVNLEGARECLERAATFVEASNKSSAKQWDEAMAAARDCELALAAVIAKLCREPITTEVALPVSSQIERGEAA
jgi:hypothetical protein